MTSKLHPIFQSIIDKTFIIPTGEVDRNKLINPRAWRNEEYMEFHESADELRECCDSYGRRGY